MLNEFVGILLGCCNYFVSEQYQEIVTAIACPIYVGIILIFTFLLCLWFARVMYSFLAGRGRKM